MISRLHSIYNNAILYKDTTQWLRKHSFEVLFFGLLLLAEVIAFFVVVLSGESQEAGKIFFGILMGILFVYALIVGIMGHNTTAREYFSHTFELYELSGLSPEKIVLGQLASMLWEFLFGFFCIVPFLFFSYMLGGVDFGVILGSSLGICLLFLPFALFSLIFSFSFKGKVAKVVFFILLVFFLPRLLVIPMMIGFSRGHFMMGGIIKIVTNMLSLNTEGFFYFLIFLIFYSEICVLLFYLCSHFICRINDSRELEVKTSGFVLIVTILGFFPLFMGFIRGASPQISDYYMFSVPIYFLMLIMGFLFYYNRFEEPRVVAKRYFSKKGIQKTLYRFFHPSPHYMFKYYCVILAVLLVNCGFLYLVLGLKTSQHERAFSNAFSICFQAPFFIAFPGGIFLLLFRNRKKGYKNARILVLVWWFVAPMIVMILGGMLRVVMYSMYHRDSPLYLFVSMILSPFTMPFAGGSDLRDMHGFIFGIRFCLGLLGLYLMFKFAPKRVHDSSQYKLAATLEAAKSKASGKSLC